jgi:uncharacterized membrane protein YhaH (DUF805 family)
MGPVAAVKSCLSNYVTFSGRAPRSEFWFFTLFSILSGIVAAIIDNILGTAYQMPLPNGTTLHAGYGYIYTLWALLLVLPSISVIVRRLHDCDRSGWWFWLYLIPIVGAIWLLVWFCMRGTQGDNRYGPDPLTAMPGANAV